MKTICKFAISLTLLSSAVVSSATTAQQQAILAQSKATQIATNSKSLPTYPYTATMSLGTFNTIYARSVCGGNYAASSKGLNCAVNAVNANPLDTQSSYVQALNNYKKSYPYIQIK